MSNIYKQTTNNDYCSETIDCQVQPGQALHVLVTYDEVMTSGTPQVEENWHLCLCMCCCCFVRYVSGNTCG